MAYLGNYFPMAVLDTYLASRKKLGHASNSDFLFPSVGGKSAQVLELPLMQVQIPPAPVSDDIYRKWL